MEKNLMNAEHEERNESKITLKKKPVIEVLDSNKEKVYASEAGCGYCSDVC